MSIALYFTALGMFALGCVVGILLYIFMCKRYPDGYYRAHTYFKTSNEMFIDVDFVIPPEHLRKKSYIFLRLDNDLNYKLSKRKKKQLLYLEKRGM